MESDAAVHPGQPAGTEPADAAVTALYQAHALGLIRLAYLMLGDASAAEDVVQAVNDAQTFAALLTPDGSKIVSATDTQTLRPPSAELAFTEFSARTGHVLAERDRWRLTGHWPEQEEEVLWSNADGSTLIVVAHRPGAAASSQGDFPIQFGILRGNRYTPLPGAPNLNQLSVWPTW